MTSLTTSNIDGNAQDNAQTDNSFDHTEIKGRFNQYTSGYWALALPALAARYVARYAGKIFKPELQHWNISKNFYATAVGSWMLGITGIYTMSTYGDMKRVFSEPLAYEFDKKPEDINIRDFFKSKNAIVQTTLHNFLKRSFLRTAFASSFFSFLLPGQRFKNLDVDPVDLGTGLTGGYLVSDVLIRKMTFFEALQNFIDNKINHSESVGQIITDDDLMNLYAIHARDNPPDRLISGKMDTVGWRNDKIIFSRMADLMNQTYRNEPSKEQADFTVPKLIYLLGNNLLSRENKENSLTYIEIANRYGIPAVKEVVQSVQDGSTLAEAIQKYPVTLPEDRAVGKVPAEKKFTDTISASPLSLAEQVVAKRQKNDTESQLNLSV